MKPESPEFCMLNNLRRVTRLLAQNMDHGLSEVGIKSTQFSLLVTLKQAGVVPISELAELLTLERTTLTRNLKPLLERGWVKKVNGVDQRIKLISISNEGLSILTQAEPVWRKTQMALVQNLGTENWMAHYTAVNEIGKGVA